MASIIFNKRGMHVRLGKIGRRMVRNNEVLRVSRDGLAFVLDNIYDDVYSIGCFYTNEPDRGAGIDDVDWFSVCWATFTISSPGLRHFGLAPETYVVERHLWHKTHEYLRTRLDVTDNIHFNECIDDILGWLFWRNKAIDFPTNGELSWTEPIICWADRVDQQDLIMEQQEN